MHKKPIKMKMILECEFYKVSEKKKIFTFGYFHTNVNIITESTNVDEVYNTCKDDIVEKIGQFTNQGSGWIFEKVINLDIHIDKYNPITAKSYIPLPLLISKMKITNVSNGLYYQVYSQLIKILID